MRIALLATILIGVGCPTYMRSLQSSFFSKFSLRELVEKHKSRAGLDCSAGGGGGGGGGIGMGGGGVGSKESHSHKGESFSCRLKSGGTEQFDEAGFMGALSEEVEREIKESGAEVIDRGTPDPSSFYFEYRLEDVGGRVEISGRKLSGDFYSLAADLDERGKRSTK